MTGDLVSALTNLDEKACMAIVRRRLDAGQDPLEILDEAKDAMGIVGQRFADGEYFIAELIFSGELMRQIGELVKPRLTQNAAQTKRLGAVVLGTVAGDIHNLGLNIVDLMLDLNGFEVHNLGVDVPAQRFVEKIEATGASIVGLSSMLTLAYDSMKQTVEAIQAAGFRDKVKIMIGGSQVNDEIARYVGADAYGEDAMAAVRLSKEWMGVK